MTDEELIAKFQERVAAGEIDLRPLGELIFGKFDQDWPARLIALARRGAAVQWRPIEDIADLPLRASYLGGWQDENGKINPGWIFHKHTETPNMHSYVSHFLPLSALEQTP